MRALLRGIVLFATSFLAGCGETSESDPAPCVDAGSWSRVLAEVPEVASGLVRELTRDACSAEGTFCEFSTHPRSNSDWAFGISVQYVTRDSAEADCIYVPGAGHTWYFDAAGNLVQDFPAL
ncbi:MAG: hypothetical protein ACT4NL_02635 [Pseudomarimonas sp.]